MKLGAYDYQTKPARIDELEALVEKAADKARLRQENATLRLERQGWAAAAARAGLTLREVEREYIQAVLAAHQGHRGRTARALGLDPKTLYNKLGASRPRRRAAGPELADQRR
jgi:DNA-binding NtrC family response regulator